MKTTTKIKILTDKNGKKVLLDTMEAFNDACNEIAAVCFKEHSANKFGVQKIVYHSIRAKYGLSAQLTIRAIAKACESYKLNKKVCPKFKKRGCITYDQRILTFKGMDLAYPQVSLTTLEGRKLFNIAIRDYYKGRTDRIVGQVDLVYRDSEFYLYASTDMPENTPINPENIIGVDLGVNNIAVSSDRQVFASDNLEKVRLRYLKQRSQLQAKQTKASKKKLREISGREARFRSDTNHCISKKLVKTAKDTNSAIALEDLTGINERGTVRKSQRAKRHSWAFYQLRMFITYKAALAGVPVVLVDPRNTSRMCRMCGHTEKANRKSQEVFCCKSCGHSENADYNAACNIAARGASIIPLWSVKPLLKVA
jgi:IS605 OrfB family transposase